MKTVCLVTALLFFNGSFGQDIKQKISTAIDGLEKDSQFTHAIISMYIVDGKTGKLLYEKNSKMGLAPASCQKIVTSTAAFELLGKDFQFKTTIGYDGLIKDHMVKANLYISGGGDPTFGSWRWKETSEDYTITRLVDELKKAGISTISRLVLDDSKWGTQDIPGGWVWEDIGNYYGAGCRTLNWHENQYDISLKPGKNIGDDVEVLTPLPVGMIKMISEVKTAAKGTGDQAYVYSAPYSRFTFIRGTIPAGTDSFTITASMPDPVSTLQYKLVNSLSAAGVAVQGVETKTSSYLTGFGMEDKMENILFSFLSPSLDSMNYWFLKRSVNLYGEAFVKAIAYEKTQHAGTDTGVAVIKSFWDKQGIERSALHIIDGSGLSPANRVTTEALVMIMQYAKQRPWFNSFYYALPEMNGIKMKDGYIGGVRSYTGYIKSKKGPEYTFSFIVNNFDGNAATVREKIWKLLDLLK